MRVLVQLGKLPIGAEWMTESGLTQGKVLEHAGNVVKVELAGGGRASFRQGMEVVWLPARPTYPEVT